MAGQLRESGNAAASVTCSKHYSGWMAWHESIQQSAYKQAGALKSCSSERWGHPLQLHCMQTTYSCRSIETRLSSCRRCTCRWVLVFPLPRALCSGVRICRCLQADRGRQAGGRAGGQEWRVGGRWERNQHRAARWPLACKISPAHKFLLLLQLNPEAAAARRDRGAPAVRLRLQQAQVTR